MATIHRFYVGRQDDFRDEDARLLKTLRNEVGLSNLEDIRVFSRYDIEDLPETLIDVVKTTILSEPRTDVLFETLPEAYASRLSIAVEALPGQYDQRADSCRQCIELFSGNRPLLRTAQVYVLFGDLTRDDVTRVENYLVNPVEARLAALEKPTDLAQTVPEPPPVLAVDGFIQMSEGQLEKLRTEKGLAMDLADILFMQAYFKEEGRNPTETELRVLDTYWSDHCRHTTFNTALDKIDIADPKVRAGFDEYLSVRGEVYGDGAKTRPVTLMDMATLATKYLKKTNRVANLDESEEINACSVKIEVETPQGTEPWLYMFKNETHNHPTEIEPFGGAATCLGGAIRDPLSGRSYVYQGLRLSGAADPRKPLDETLPGKLPQRRICDLAARGFSSYGNQIGLATGLVDEVYHPGYEAKRMEVGAVIAAAPAANVVREVPEAGDVVILVGGRTGRDGCGGATGSSKTHTEESLETSGAEVQKGNPVEERKIQRLFRRPEVAKRIRRCNDFGAGGVSVAIGELADGLYIDLDAIPKKYEGLSGTELAISESQERMACVIRQKDWEMFQSACAEENLEATLVAHVTEAPRLVMEWRGQRIVDLSRAFVDSAGAKRTMQVAVSEAATVEPAKEEGSFVEQMKRVAGTLNVASKRGLGEMFDSTIGAGTVLFPFGGKHQRTPIQTMAAAIPLLEGETPTTSLFTYGFNPYQMEENPFIGAYEAVVESVTKLLAAGASSRHVYLSLQEYFHSLRNDPLRWGKPFQAVLGAFLAQLDCAMPAIGGKDSMSGSFETMDVPPTLISFATTITHADRVISPEWKTPGNRLYLMRFPRTAEGRLDTAEFDRLWDAFQSAVGDGHIVSAWAIGRGGLAEALLKMAVGNGFGAKLDSATLPQEAFAAAAVGTILLESPGPLAWATPIGEVVAEPTLTYRDEAIPLSTLLPIWEEALDAVYVRESSDVSDAAKAVSLFEKRPAARKVPSVAKPKAIVPVFPGTNCEYDTVRALKAAGADAEALVVTNRTPEQLIASVARMEKALRSAQMLVFPGGFSFGDEPDGSGKFIAAFFREARLRDAVERLLDEQDGLILGICNGFQALVKLGLLPYGRIVDPRENDCTLTFNTIGRHQSRYVRTKMVSVHSPWLAAVAPGDVHSIAISHGEGRFVASPDTLQRLAEQGQIATQYVSLEGVPSMASTDNPNGSLWAIEGLTSENGRILGKMGHSERIGAYVAKNIPGNKDQKLFQSGVRYFTD